MKTLSLLFCGLSLFCGTAFGSNSDADRFINRALAAAEQATGKDSSGSKILFVWVNDDGESAPTASIVHKLTVSNQRIQLDSDVRHEGSRFALRGSLSAQEERWRRLAGSVNAVLKLGEGRQVRDGSVSSTVEFEATLENLALERGKPVLLNLNRMANGPGDVGKFDEVNSLLVVWR